MWYSFGVMRKSTNHFFNILRQICLFVVNITKRGVFAARQPRMADFAENNAAHLQPAPIVRHNRWAARDYLWRRRKAQRGAASLNSHDSKNGGRNGGASIDKESPVGFIPDQPIEDEKEDILDRGKFVDHLSNALLGWKESKSIVIALCGEWGSGKSSIIKLTLNKIKAKQNKDKPTIVKFNPWEFSEKGNLTKCFFNEIAKELNINNSGEDKKTARKLYLYAKRLELISFPITPLINWLSKFFIVFGLSGIAGGFYIPSDWLEIVLFIIGTIFTVIGFLKEKMIALANFLEAKREFFSKSASEVKDEIIEQLKKRKRKILVVIDDIDRLNHSEIKQIFQIIKINADFPNTIYLLAYDKAVVAKSLYDEQKGILGKDYIDKIVQVDFDIPTVKGTKIWDYFNDKLEAVKKKLPKGTVKRYFMDDENSWRWSMFCELGIRNFIKTIRDAKRFINCLEFNFPQMQRDGMIEVNPIDFIAVEAIRIFAPSFYSFIKNEKTLFTSTTNESQEKNASVQKVQEEIGKLQSDKIRNSISNIIKELFPQMYSNNVLYTEIQKSSERRAYLRICDRDYFDNYFTLLPGGGEYELSQFEIKKILDSADSAKSLEKILMEHVDNGEINNTVIRIGDFANDKDMVPLKNIKNIIKEIFDVSDNLHGNTLIICYKFLGRQNDKDKVLEILKETIPHSRGLYWPVSLIYHETKAEPMEGVKLIVPKDKMEEMREMCVNLIENFDVDNLLKNEHLGFIINRWYEWDEEKCKKFMQGIQENEEQLLAFIGKFTIMEEHAQFRGSLLKFLDGEKTESTLKRIRAKSPNLYETYKREIDLYLGDSSQ